MKQFIGKTLSRIGALLLWSWNNFWWLLVRRRVTSPLLWIAATLAIVAGAYYGPAVVNDQLEIVQTNPGAKAKPRIIPHAHPASATIAASTFGFDDKSNAALPQTDFGDKLETAWGGKHGSLTSSNAGDTLVAEYRAAVASDSLHRMSLGQYLNIADQDAREVRAHLDWQGVAAKYRLDQKKLASLKRFASWYDGHTAGSYALTELAPGRDKLGGVRDAKWINDLLQHAGREYVESLPAIYDGKTSFGPFQFTEYALYDAAGGPRGASIMNKFLPEDMQVPGSVKLLRGNMHFRAAFLFALHNFAKLLQRINTHQLDALEVAQKERNEGILAYVATSHHLPGPAITAAERWLDQKVRHKTWKPFAVSCSGALRLYAHKTAWNELAVRKYRLT